MQQAPVSTYLASFAFVGLAANLSGPALSHLRDRIGTDNGGIAIVFATQAVGYVAGSLLAGPVLDRGRGHRLVGWSLAAATVAVLAIAASGSIVALSAAFFVLGVALGLVDVSGNTLVVWSRPGRSNAALNALHLWFALGALASPLVINRALAWSGSVWPLALPLGVLAVVCGRSLRSVPVPSRTRLPPPDVVGAVRPRRWQLAAVCVFFFCYVGVETGFAGWIHSYVEQIEYGGSGVATGVTAVFWTGFALGRAVAVRVAASVSAARMLAVSLVGTVIASASFWLFGSGGPMLWVVTFAFAVSVAPQYASMMAFAETRLTLSGGATSALVASSGMGILALPWLLGELFDRWGPDALPPTIAVGAVVVGASALVVSWTLRVGQRPPVTSMKVPVT